VRLYAFMCRHAAAQISRRGFLRPAPQFALGGRAIVWLTTQPHPDGRPLGVAPHALDCDHLERRYVVNVDDAVSWPVFKNRLPIDQLVMLDTLSAEHAPEHWFVLERPVFAAQDLTYRPVIPAGVALS
jgi:hypothetical protein